MRNLEQEAYWLTSWGIQMPWVGLDTVGCPYMQNNCTAQAPVETDVQKFSYPIQIRKEYPRVSFHKNYSIRLIPVFVILP